MTTTPAEQEVTNLLPCPFCGKPPKLFQIPKHYDPRFEKPSGEMVDKAHCMNSSCAIRNISMTPETWSRRVAAAEGQAARLIQDLATVPLDALENKNAPLSARMNLFSVLRSMQERALAASPPTAPHEPPLVGCPTQWFDSVAQRWKCACPAPQREGE